MRRLHAVCFCTAACQAKADWLPVPGRLIQCRQTRTTPPLELKRFERELNERHDRSIATCQGLAAGSMLRITEAATVTARCAGGRCSSEQGEKELPHRLYEGKGGGRGGHTPHRKPALRTGSLSAVYHEHDKYRVGLSNPGAWTEHVAKASGSVYVQRAAASI
ncbi:Serine/threonine-protein phosphatase 1 regulatory subunit 10 [Clarias magur]|uniref:Serine/threonine-protein phosphatase 1 regulatory subunit 10 n=1 Tax=Clarias magur TaxID=1594786 RepID=A0A8J4XHW7_CLAMG|nr:Serine/threonine-protein phosphatase 1 regulatory subunit 10 [Clarias magur]